MSKLSSLILAASTIFVTMLACSALLIGASGGMPGLFFGLLTILLYIGSALVCVVILRSRHQDGSPLSGTEGLALVFVFVAGVLLIVSTIKIVSY